MKIKLSAVIPTTQFGNIQPEFEVESSDPTEMANLENYIQALWDKYGERPLLINQGSFKKLDAFIGGSIFYDEQAHVYQNEKGEVYLSGSQYAKQFEQEFDANRVAGAIADKFKVDVQAIKDMWQLKADISKGFGTAIHKALEMYGRYNGLAESIDKNTALHDNPVIKKAVESFYAGRKDEKAIYEALIVDHNAKRAGQVDRLLVTKRKHCRIQDYKTNANIEKSLPVYWKQLEFYAGIMEAGGWTVEGLDIFWWSGEWKAFNKELK